jgi:hydrogenase maturation protease
MPVKPAKELGKILIAGVGNILMSDDGFGPRVVEILSNKILPDNVELRNFGTSSLFLASELIKYKLIIFIDAIEIEGTPGALYRVDLKQDDMKMDESSQLGLSIHDMGLDDLLKLSNVMGTLPKKMIVVGCKPVDSSPGSCLSDEVKRAAEKAVKMVLEILETVTTT